MAAITPIPAATADNVEVISIFNTGASSATTPTVIQGGIGLGGFGQDVLLVDLNPTRRLTATCCRDGSKPEFIEAGYVRARHASYAGMVAHSLPHCDNVKLLAGQANSIELQNKLATAYSNLTSDQPFTAEGAAGEMKVLRHLISRSAALAFPGKMVFVLIDCTGADDILAYAALHASDSFYTPCNADTESEEGVNQVLTRVFPEVVRYANIVNRIHSTGAPGVENIRVPYYRGAMMMNLARPSRPELEDATEPSAASKAEHYVAEDRKLMERIETLVKQAVVTHLAPHGRDGTQGVTFVQKLRPAYNAGRIAGQCHVPVMLLDKHNRTSHERATIDHYIDEYQALARHMVSQVRLIRPRSSPVPPNTAFALPYTHKAPRAPSAPRVSNTQIKSPTAAPAPPPKAVSGSKASPPNQRLGAPSAAAAHAAHAGAAAAEIAVDEVGTKRSYESSSEDEDEAPKAKIARRA